MWIRRFIADLSLTRKLMLITMLIVLAAITVAPQLTLWLPTVFYR